MNNIHLQRDLEVDIDKLISENDDTYMQLPEMESEPHLLISKVRKHYMEYMIKILSNNYETNHRLQNKNIYLPSAIWKCAKKLEMKAAQACMVVQIYRKSIVSMINDVKTYTNKGRLYNKLYESLHKEPHNEKKTQTVVTGENCQCYCNDKKRRRKRSSCVPAQALPKRDEEMVTLHDSNTSCIAQTIPVVTNMRVNTPTFVPPDPPTNFNHPTQQPPAMTPMHPGQESDDLLLQLEKLFKDDDQDDDDLFSRTLIGGNDNNISLPNGIHNGTQDSIKQDSIIENHAAQIKSLDERLATLTGMLANNEPSIPEPVPIPVQKPQPRVIEKKQKHISKWRCEEYFLKMNLFELLYRIGDTNRNKLMRIKEMYFKLFGDDSDDEEGVMSPEESQEFVGSCKARIDGWVMMILAPYYAKGHIQGKMLYKGVARHLIELIYKCKQYPSQHEVTSFVMDFLENRGKISCEADYKAFRIENVNVPSNYTVV